MSENIGQAAGAIWQYLKQNGSATTSRLSQQCDLDNKSLQRAVGWLAREDKISFEKQGRSELLKLK